MKKETDPLETHVKVRSYGVTELGMLYNPTLQPESAGKALIRWIKLNRGLTAALQEAGWRKGQRKFTPLQSQQIFDFLGEPW